MAKPSPKVTGVFGCGHAFEPSNVTTFLNKVLGRDQERCSICALKQSRRWYERKGKKLRAQQRAAAGKTPRTLGHLYGGDV